MRLLPWAALRVVASVLTFGSKKHATDWGWRNISVDDHLDAAFRHLASHADGDLIDDESGLPHVAHAVCRMLFILDLRSKVKGQSRSVAITREQLVCMTGEEVRSIFEDRGHYGDTEPCATVHYSEARPTVVI